MIQEKNIYAIPILAFWNLFINIPFGALFGDSQDGTGQKYKYGGKELDRMFGLDWYDFENRWVTSVLGRFMTMDPLAEKYYSISPYAYCLNNPIRYIGPTGIILN